MRKLIDKEVCLFAVFDEEERLLDAVKLANDKKFIIRDILLPYPIKSLDNIIKPQKNLLNIVSFISGTIGLLISLGLIVYIHTKLMLTFGNKWLLPLLNSIPIIFLMIILFASIGAVCYFLIKNDLIAGRIPYIYNPEITDNYFMIIFEQSESQDELIRLMEDSGAKKIYNDTYFRQNYHLPLPVKVKLS